MSGMQLLYHDFGLFLKKRALWGRQAAAKGDAVLEPAQLPQGCTGPSCLASHAGLEALVFPEDKS